MQFNPHGSDSNWREPVTLCQMLEPLFVVVVNWNLKTDTLACVESLAATGAAMERVIIVDNGSTDGSVTALQTRFDGRLPLLQNRENLGYVHGINQGIQYALDRAAQWILLLNNDTVVSPAFFLELQRAACQDIRYSILAPLILYCEWPDRVWRLGDRLVPGLLFTNSLYRDRREPTNPPLLMPVDFVTGCAMLVKREVFERIGLFDLDLGMYGEDVEFCWRARQAGYLIAAAPHAQMWHKVSASAEHNRLAARYLRIRNQNRFYAKHSRGLQRPLMLGLSGVRAVAIALADVWHRQPSLIIPLFRGWLRGWLANDTVER